MLNNSSMLQKELDWEKIRQQLVSAPLDVGIIFPYLKKEAKIVFLNNCLLSLGI